jgi:hypothetical protein
MSTTFSQNFSPIDDDYKEISLSKEIDFKTDTETSDAGSLSIQIQMT